METTLVIAVGLTLVIAFFGAKFVWPSGKQLNDAGHVVLRESGDLEHRRFATRVLRRELFRNEVVHHINGKRADNELSNLCVMDREKHEHFHA